MPCFGSCRTCAGVATNCIGCDAPLFLDGSSCVPACSGTQFNDSSSNLCTACPANCSGCSGGVCTGCLNGIVLVDGKCEVGCQESQFFNGTECTDCNPECSSCEDLTGLCVVDLKFEAQVHTKSDIDELTPTDTEGPTLRLKLNLVFKNEPYNLTDESIKLLANQGLTITLESSQMQYKYYLSAEGDLILEISLPDSMIAGSEYTITIAQNGKFAEITSTKEYNFKEPNEPQTIQFTKDIEIPQSSINLAQDASKISGDSLNKSSLFTNGLSFLAIILGAD